MLKACLVCCEAKPNTQSDRGLVGALPILDSIQVDEFATYDYVLTVVDALSRFVRFFPCRKTVTGEKAFQILWEGWFQVYGLPREVVIDNDVRFTPRRVSGPSQWQVSE